MFSTQKVCTKPVIIFDFDGVIADSFTIAFSVAQLTFPTLTLESYQEKWNTNISKAIFTEPKSIEPIDFQFEFAKRMQELVISPEKKEALVKLSEKFDFHIISSTNTSTIEEFCRRNDILDMFGEILGYDFERIKVKKFIYLLEKYSLDPSSLIFITDTAGDVEEAQEVAISTIIAVTDGYQEKESLEKANPTLLVSSLCEIPKIILNS